MSYSLRDVNAKVYKRDRNPERPFEADAWVGDVRARFAGDFTTKEEADKFVSDLNAGLQRLLEPTTEAVEEKVSRGPFKPLNERPEANQPSIADHFSVDTTSPTYDNWNNGR